MAAIRQQLLPIDTRPARGRSVRGAATFRPEVAPVRWGAAVVERAPQVVARTTQSTSWQHLGSKSSRGRRTDVWSLANPAVAAPEVAAGGEAFARNRIRHAAELSMACMLIVAALAAAMFV